MEEILGLSPPVFVGLTMVLFGGAALMTGQALAATWRPSWHAVPYCLLLAAGNRFLAFALFEGLLLHVTGYLVAAGYLIVVAIFAYRVIKAAKMVNQYPWRYDRAGLFGWREKP